MSVKFAVLVLSLAVSAFGFWRYQAAGRSSAVARFAIVQDASDSISTDCGRTAALVRRSLQLAPSGAGSTITLFALGDATTANEPRLMGEFGVPVTRRVIEGKQLEQRARDQLFTDVRTRCANIPQTQRSPIFQGVRRAVEHLTSSGSTSDLRYLFVQTDGEETEDRDIVRALNQKPGTQAKLPAAVSNSGVRVTFCGTAETVGVVRDSDRRLHHKSKARDSKRADRSREVWLKLFTNPELVTFQPYCGGSASE